MSVFDTKSSPARLLIGFLIFLGTTGWLLSTAAFVARAEKAEGTVMNSYKCRSASWRRRRSRCGDVSFTQADGVRRTLSEVRGAGSPGERVEVLYNPMKPDETKLNGLRHLWLMPLVFELIGVVFLVDSARKLLAESTRS